MIKDMINIKIKIIAFIILLTISIAGGIYSYKKSGSYKNEIVKKQEGQMTTEEQIKQGEVKKAREDYEMIRKITEEKDLQKCRELKSPKNDECVYKIINISKNVKYCQEIKDGKIKEKCEELFVLEDILKTNSSKECLNLKTILKGYCLDYFFVHFKDLEECDIFEKDDKARCSDMVNKMIASNSNNISDCGLIQDKLLVSDCKLAVSSKPSDSDSDGLLDSEELSYGTNLFNKDTDNDNLSDYDELARHYTNPKKPDTDGDGYSDGDEIRNGHDPLK